jgi:hypothetical protein
MDELAMTKISENDEYTVVSWATNEKDLQFLLDYTKRYEPEPPSNRGSRSNSLDLSQDSSREENKSMESLETAVESTQRKRIESPRKYHIKPFEKPPEDEQKRLRTVLDNSVNRKFSLEHLTKMREPGDLNRPEKDKVRMSIK